MPANGAEPPRFRPKGMPRLLQPNQCLPVECAGLDLAASFAGTFPRDPGAFRLNVEVPRALMAHPVPTRGLRLAARTVADPRQATSSR